MEGANYYAEQAVAYDRVGQYDAAIYFYTEAARQIYGSHPENLPESLRQVAEKYENRAQLLQYQRSQMVSSQTKSDSQINEERAEFLLNQALDNDEAKKFKEALTLYMEAVEFCLKCCDLSESEERKAKFRELATRALDRGEAIKRILNQIVDLPNVPTEELSNLQLLPAGNASTSEGKIETPNNKRKSRPVESYDEFELKVLACTTRINGISYVPFLEYDLNERFGYPVPFSDKHSLLQLSAKQKSKLKAWMRPDEFMSEPKVIDNIDSGTIKQTIISDCSFVASLAVSARYEKRHGTRLVTKIIYPQNRHGEPIYNPCGKYMIKFHLNGVYRKVIIDDRLPIGQHGELLCSYSKNKNELWVALLEKAYMKVMGGYDFPGSNSNIDLHALTGWIPERIAIRPNSSEFDASKVFEKLFTRFHQGHCLITLATGKISTAEQERTGLVDAHAYAVLDLRKFKDKRLLLVKNPWTHLRWKGRFSEKDLTSWTPEMRKALDYDPTSAQQFDDGVFWIDYESVCAFFDVFYVNWNPSLFPFTYALHSAWSAGVGPVKDLYTISENPQYYLEVNNKHDSASVWILLTRHITDKEDFADNKEYITILIYKSGKKVYLPFDPKPLFDGARINSPHYLCQFVIKDPGIQRYTLVVAQYEKSTTIYYTLRVYSSSEFKCGKIKVSYKFKKVETGKWEGKSAGGCGNGSSRETYKNNPIYHISLTDGSDDNDLLIDLRGPKQYSVGFEIFQVSSYRGRKIENRDSGSFRPGCTVLQMDSLPGGVYAIRPMTFLPGQEGPFILKVEASCDFTLKRVQ